MMLKKKWNAIFGGLLLFISMNMLFLFSSHRRLEKSLHMGGKRLLPTNSHDKGNNLPTRGEKQEVHTITQSPRKILSERGKDEKKQVESSRSEIEHKGEENEKKVEEKPKGHSPDIEIEQNEDFKDQDNNQEEEYSPAKGDSVEKQSKKQVDELGNQDGRESFNKGGSKSTIQGKEENEDFQGFEKLRKSIEQNEDLKAENLSGNEIVEAPPSTESHIHQNTHNVAGLNCDAHGGPDDPSEMVYWEDIPLDAQHVSPLKSTGTERKYLTFEPDQGGWNNIRMSMETAVTLAHAMGRILVMPPEQGMYLLGDVKGNQKRHFTFSDFFHFDAVATEHAGIEVISTEEFLNREVMTGKMKEKQTGKTTYPPLNNRTKWDNVPHAEIEMLNSWFRTFSETPIWKTDVCMVGLPKNPGPEGPQRLLQMMEKLKGRYFEERSSKYLGKPVPFDADPIERLDESLVNRQEICVYNETYQNAKVIHMMGDNDSGARLLVHFYAYLFFEDWKHGLWTRRFVRDHLRYADEIQCPAARVVKAMRQKAIQHGNLDGLFDTMHIRRGDFQYKDTRVEATDIYENIKELIPEGTTVFIATDERQKDFFKIFQQHYHVYFLSDFSHELNDVNTNFYGMIDQRVASRGRTFIGCYYSTFTGYINRMRGYHSQKEKSNGWEQGIVNSWYYIPREQKEALRVYMPLSPPLWAREFPLAWRDLNHGISELAEK
jgi:GDP-fucose protein O-fucosyltransferase